MTNAPAPAVAKKKRSGKSLRDTLTAYSFIAPNFIGFCVFTLVPMVFAIVLAFCNWDGVHPVEFAGLQNFIDLMGDKTFKAAFVNTIIYTAATEGFPTDEASKEALTTTAVYLEMGLSDKASEIETVLNQEHDAIMTGASTIDEGIAAMNEGVQAILNG